jgi:hypothetical protein
MLKPIVNKYIEDCLWVSTWRHIRFSVLDSVDVFICNSLWTDSLWTPFVPFTRNSVEVFTGDKLKEIQNEK